MSKLGEKIETIRNRMRTNITDLDLKRYFPETNQPNDNVIKYSELANVQSLDEILPHDKSWKIILLEQELNKGHWMMICRYGNTYCEFDSYGKRIDEELKFVDKIQKILLGQNRKYITELLNKLPKKTKKIWNKKKLQKITNASATCGRWCILFVICMRDYGFDLKEFQQFIDKWSKELNLTPDELVSHWVK